MRVEPAPYVFRSTDRRQRSDTRGQGQERRRPETEQRRARHSGPKWFHASFGAHLLGQVAPETVNPRIAVRAYQQPEARMVPRLGKVRVA
jgi:hypothetical protein